MTTITLKLEATAAIQALRDIDDAAADLPAEAFGEIVERFLDGSDLASELRLVQSDNGTALAGELPVRLDPSDRLLCLSAAIRARNFDVMIVEAEGHGSFSDGGVDNPIVGATGEGVEAASSPVDAHTPEDGGAA